MKALTLGSRRAAVKDVPLPNVAEGFALIRVIASGICSTDLQLLAGYYNFKGIPGHEFVGVVEGPASSKWMGKRVVGEINLACGQCTMCRKGLRRHCFNRTVLGIVAHPGSHAEFLTLPEINLHEVPGEISDEEAVFVEPLAAACEVLDQVHVGLGTKAVVLGPGKLGRLIVQVLKDVGAEVATLGRQDRADPHAFDLVVEATGVPQGIIRALELVRPRGTIVWKSTFHGPAKFDAAQLVVNEITVVGSRCGRFERALDLLRRRRVEVASLLAKEFPLAEGVKALRTAAKPGMLKVVLRP